MNDIYRATSTGRLLRGDGEGGHVIGQRTAYDAFRCLELAIQAVGCNGTPDQITDAAAKFHAFVTNEQEIRSRVIDALG